MIVANYGDLRFLTAVVAANGCCTGSINDGSVKTLNKISFRSENQRLSDLAVWENSLLARKGPMKSKLEPRSVTMIG